ncbi:MAG: hypothetical protein AMXMBFR72_17550, partial [Betaproteobacteria bacterium]
RRPPSPSSAAPAATRPRRSSSLARAPRSSPPAAS